MASTYYNSSGKEVSDGDIAYADDLNSINSAVDAAFQLAEADIVAAGGDATYWAGIAEGHADSAEADATQTAADRVQTGSDRASATASASSATSSASTASTAASTATTKAALAEQWAEESEDVPVTTGKYSAKHWAAKAQASAGLQTLTGTGVDNTDPHNPVISITKSTISLGNVDNTSDANKPISTATQSALDAKAPLASPTFTGAPAAPTAAPGTDTTQIATTAFVIANAPAQTPIKLFHMQDQRTQGSDGASSSVGINTRVLNTVLLNDITGASLLANQVTLPAGTYFIEARGTMGANVSGNKLRLYNVTDSTYILEGTVDNLAYVPSTLTGTITLADQKVLELRHYTVAGLAGAFGTAISQGVEVYADLKIWSLP